MKKILALILILTTLTVSFIACSSDDNATSKKDNDDKEAESTQGSNNSSTSENKHVIPTDPDELIQVITNMGFEPMVQTFSANDQEMADDMGISVEAIDGLVLVGFSIPNTAEDYGPSAFLQFAFCTNLKNALELRSCLGPEEETESIIIQEGTIVATGTDYVWDAFVDFVTNNNSGTKNPTNNNTSKDSTNANSVVTTVTRDEWKNAFDLSQYENFTFNADMFFSEQDSVWIIKATVKQKDGFIYREYTGSQNDEVQEKTDSYEGKISSLRDIDLLGIFSCMLDTLEKSSSYGYTMFTYNESTKSYFAENVDVDGPCNINIWFEDKKIVKLCFTAYGNQEIDATFTFSFDVN